MNEHWNDRGLEQVKRALNALREASAGLQAPEHIESKLRQTFRTQHGKPRPSRRYGWLAAAIAASLLAAAVVRLSLPSAVSAPEPKVAAKKEIFQPLRRNEPKSEPTVAQAKPAARRVKRLPAVAKSKEVATDFFAIPYAPVLTQVDPGQVVRVKVPAASMRTFGLPVNEERMFERVRADVLLGEDGIARAIRFVR